MAVKVVFLEVLHKSKVPHKLNRIINPVFHHKIFSRQSKDFIRNSNKALLAKIHNKNHETSLTKILNKDLKALLTKILLNNHKVLLVKILKINQKTKLVKTILKILKINPTKVMSNNFQKKQAKVLFNNHKVFSNQIIKITNLIPRAFLKIFRTKVNNKRKYLEWIFNKPNKFTKVNFKIHLSMLQTARFSNNLRFHNKIIRMDRSVVW
jgi:hypothetical protein